MWKSPDSHSRPTGCVLLWPHKENRAAFCPGQPASTDHAAFSRGLPNLVVIRDMNLRLRKQARVFVSLVNKKAGLLPPSPPGGSIAALIKCHVDLVTEVIQAPRQGLATSQNCLSGKSAAGSLGDHVATLKEKWWEKSIQKYWEAKAWLVALEVVTEATLSAGSRSLSLRLSQHHHNEQLSLWSWGGGKVCEDNRRGRIFYRRQSQDSAVGRKWKTISGRQSQSESISPWGSWGAVRSTIQWDENR